MKKIVTIIIVLFFMFIPSAYGIQKIDIHKDIISKNQNEHTVFVEYATTTWCSQCPDASKALYELYDSSQYPFFYVSLVSDVNPNAKIRTKDYQTVAIPTIYVDGGRSLFVGNSGSYQEIKDTYQKMILENTNQAVEQDISIETKGQWLDDAQIKIDVTITNNDNTFFYGKIRTYVNEINSRWLDEQGNPYHHALLDFAFNENIFLPKKSSKSFSTIWDGKEDHNGLTFEDITKDNIMILSSVFHWAPHIRLGYVGFPYLQLFFAHYAYYVDGVTLT